MKRVLFGFGIAVLVAGSQVTFGQPGGNPFIDHNERGETVHVLPPPAMIRAPQDTQPVEAPPRSELKVYRASYGAGNLADHHGPEISLAGFFAIYWNAAVASSAGSQGHSTLQETIYSFVTNFSDGADYSSTDPSADYSIIQQYGSTNAISPQLAWAGDMVDGQTTQSSISDTEIQTYLKSKFSSHQVTADSHTIYAVYFPSGMTVSLQPGSNSCSSFCGYHGNFDYNGTDVKYAVFPYADCSGCKLSGKLVADMLTIVSSHEIRESVTDPDLNAWFDRVGYEADDKCAWHNLYQINRGGFWVQPEYSNANKGCVVPNK